MRIEILLLGAGAGTGQRLTTCAVTGYTAISPEPSEAVEALDVQAAFDSFLSPAFTFLDNIFAFFAFLQIPEVEL